MELIGPSGLDLPKTTLRIRTRLEVRSPNSLYKTIILKALNKLVGAMETWRNTYLGHYFCITCQFINSHWAGSEGHSPDAGVVLLDGLVETGRLLQ